MRARLVAIGMLAASIVAPVAASAQTRSPIAAVRASVAPARRAAPRRPAVVAPRRPPVLAVPRPAERTRARRLGLGTAEAANTLLFERPRSAWVAAARGTATRRYMWPLVEGAVTQGFDAQEGRHRALDIGAPCGAPLRAAHGGLVGYSAAHGASGNIVVIVHPGGWVTAYGHTRRTLVAAGALVRRGQAIAEVGDTGDAHGCHVHFILYRNGERIDPAPHMAGRLRALHARPAARR